MANITAKLSTVDGIKANLSPQQRIVVSNFTLGNVDTAIKSGTYVPTSLLSNQTLDVFPITDLRAAKYTIQASDGTDTHMFDMTVVHDGTNVYTSEYGLIQTNGELFTVDGDIDTATNNVRVLITPLVPDLRFTFARIDVKL